mgnify:CR=1 FL=1
MRQRILIATAQLAGVDSEGMHLRIGQGVYWLPFPHICNTPTQVREALVLLARSVLGGLAQKAAGDVADAARLALREQVYRRLLGKATTCRCS